MKGEYFHILVRFVLGYAGFLCVLLATSYGLAKLGIDIRGIGNLLGVLGFAAALHFATSPSRTSSTLMRMVLALHWRQLSVLSALAAVLIEYATFMLASILTTGTTGSVNPARLMIMWVVYAVIAAAFLSHRRTAQGMGRL